MTHNINLETLVARGRLSQREAQDLHTCMHHVTGTHDADSIIADWNYRSPESLWDFDGDSEYIRHLTGCVVKFMEAKNGWQSCDAVMPPESTVVATKIDDDLGVRALHDLAWDGRQWWSGGDPVQGWVPTHWKHLRN